VSRLAAAIPRALVAAPRRALRLSPRARFRLAALLLAALLLALTYQLWFRDSGFVRVEQVKVVGLTAQNGPRIEAALADAARGMTTLHVRQDELEQAVADHPVVHAIEVSTDFPHGMTIRVVERRPVAVLVSSGQRIPVAADGLVLRGVAPSAALPEVALEGGMPSRRVGDTDALRAVTVIGAAPPALAARIQAVEEERERGIVVDLGAGPEIVLGDANALREKWLAVARILADPAAEGATYVDVRLPERPVAGGLPLEAASMSSEEAEAATETPPVTPGAAAPAVPEAAPPPAAAPPTTAAPAPAQPAPQPAPTAPANPQP